MVNKPSSFYQEKLYSSLQVKCFESDLSSILLKSDSFFIGSLQNLLLFLAPLLRNSSEAHRNFSVIKSLRQSENLQVCLRSGNQSYETKRKFHVMDESYRPLGS